MRVAPPDARSGHAAPRFDLPYSQNPTGASAMTTLASIRLRFMGNVPACERALRYSDSPRNSIRTQVEPGPFPRGRNEKPVHIPPVPADTCCRSEERRVGKEWRSGREPED